MKTARYRRFAAVALIIGVSLGAGCHGSQSPPDNYKRPVNILFPAEVGKFKRGNENYPRETTQDAYTHRYYESSSPCYIAASAVIYNSAEKAEASLRALKTSFEASGFKVIEGAGATGGTRLEVRANKSGSDALQIFRIYGPVIFSFNSDAPGADKEQGANQCVRGVVEFEEGFPYQKAVEVNASD